MIANVLSLNEMTKKYRVTFDSRHENAFEMYIGYNIVKFPDNYKELYLSKQDNKAFSKVDEDNKRNMVERLKKFKPRG